jgi:hypothetical protein
MQIRTTCVSGWTVHVNSSELATDTRHPLTQVVLTLPFESRFADKLLVKFLIK